MTRLIYILLFAILPGCRNKSHLPADATVLDTNLVVKKPDSIDISVSNYLSLPDSIFILERQGKAKDDDPMADGKPIVANGRLNETLIIHLINVKEKSRDTLINILSRIVREPTGITKCGGNNPHFSILLKTQQRYSYIDMCFSCLQIEISKDLSGVVYDDRKWQEIETFFSKRGLIRKFPH